MPDVVSPEKRSNMMAGIKGKNTKPEILIRKALHAQGFRFRLHNSQLPGKPDIILPKYKTVILVNGCFWHGHLNCRLFRLPKSRTQFWEEKINGNIARDMKNQKALAGAGWRQIIIWECALKNKKISQIESVVEKITRFLILEKNLFLEITA